MAFQPVNAVAEAVVRMTINTKVVAMTFYGEYVTGYTQPNIDDLAEIMDGWADSALKPLLSDEATYDGVFVRGLTHQQDLAAEDTTSAGAGELTTTPAPNNVCFAVKRVTGFTGRTARGRVYFPLTYELLDASNENYVNAAHAGNIVSALNGVRAAMGVVGWVEVVVSRYLNGVAREEGQSLAVTNYLYANLRVDTQRRRLP